MLRALAAFLAGATGMRWREFLIFNAAGGVVWSARMDLGAYYFGRKSTEAVAVPVSDRNWIRNPLGPWCILALLLMRRHEHELSARAEQAFPGPLRGPKK